jgi:hypothetical protein
VKVKVRKVVQREARKIGWKPQEVVRAVNFKGEDNRIENFESCEW